MKKSFVRTLCVLLSLLILFTAMPAFYAFAADYYKVTAKNHPAVFTETSKYYGADDEFDFNVYVQASELLEYSYLRVHFNPNSFLVTDFTEGDAFNESGSTLNASGINDSDYQNRGFISMGFSCGSNAADFKTEKLLFSMHFKSKGEIVDEQEIRLEIADVDGITDPNDLETQFHYIDMYSVLEDQKDNISMRGELTGGYSQLPTEATTQALEETTAAPEETTAFSAPATEPAETFSPGTEPYEETTEATESETGEWYLWGTYGDSGEDFGIDSDYDKPTPYGFKDGKLITTFKSDTYVGVKNLKTQNWYMTNGWLGKVNSAILYNTLDLGSDADKLYVPGNVEVTFILLENGDGTLDLSYTTAGEETTAAPEETSETSQPEMHKLYYLPSKNQEAAGYTYKLNFKDPNGDNPYINWHQYTFTRSLLNFDGVFLYYVEVPNYYDYVEELLYQVYDGDNWVSQITFSYVYLSDYDGALVKADGTVESEGFTQPDTTAAPEETTMYIEPVTEPDETTVPATEPATQADTTAPTDPYFGDGLYVSARLNGKNVGSVTADREKVIVIYNLNAPFFIENGNGTLYYDSSKLKLDKFEMPNIASGYHGTIKNEESFSFSGVNSETDSGIFDFKTTKPFIVAEFSAIGTGSTVVDLRIGELGGRENGQSVKYYTKGDSTALAYSVVQSLSDVDIKKEEKPVVPGYYVVGSKEVCGEEWCWEAPWKYGEPMTPASDGTYYQLFKNIPSSYDKVTSDGRGYYEFKVVYVDKNGNITWHPGSMGNTTNVSVFKDNSSIMFNFELLASSPAIEGQYPEAVKAKVYAPGETIPAIIPAETTEPIDITNPVYTTEPATAAPTTESEEIVTTAAPVDTTAAPEHTTAEPEPVTTNPPQTTPVTTAPTVIPTTIPEQPTTEPVETIPIVNITNWKVIGIKNKTYNGKKQTQSIIVIDGKRIADVSVKYYNNINAGTATLVITGEGEYTGAIVKSFKINKAKQPMKVKVYKKTVRTKSLKKKASVIKPITVRKAKGKVIYSKYKKGSTIMTYKRLSVNKKTGKITIKKNYYPKGTFKISVKITAKGNKNYKSKSVVKTISVRVK